MTSKEENMLELSDSTHYRAIWVRASAIEMIREGDQFNATFVQTSSGGCYVTQTADEVRAMLQSILQSKEEGEGR